MNIYLKHLQQIDLNLLINFYILAEEKNISKAAKRLNLSQPAVSRSLQRLREVFSDELLLRSKNGYELTSNGKRIKTELEPILPKLSQMFQGSSFNPKEESVNFRIVGTDYALKALSFITPHITSPYNDLYINFQPWTPEVYNKIENGQVDLAFLANDGLIPSSFDSEILFKDELICILDKNFHKDKKRLTLKSYLLKKHIVVSLIDNEQTLPDKELKKLGHMRKSKITVPYFSAAIDIIKKTNLVVTVPKKFINEVKLDPDLSILSPPKELKPFNYLMCWHPRLTNDPAHIWLRNEIKKLVIQT